MDIYVTPRGLERLRADLARRLAEFEDICRERAVAHELSGDGWHDNPHFNRMQQLEAAKSAEIRGLRALLAGARVVAVAEGRRPVERVAVGSLVRLRVTDEAQGNATERLWEIGGWNENDPEAGILAYNAPLAVPVMGLEPGEAREARLPRGPVVIEVVDLLPGPVGRG